MTPDTRYFQDAFLAFAYRTKFDGQFADLSIENQRAVLADAQTLKDAARVRDEAVKYLAAQPMYAGEFETDKIK